MRSIGFITTALENGAQLEDVQKAAGHRDPGTTKLYDRRGCEGAGAVQRDFSWSACPCGLGGNLHPLETTPKGPSFGLRPWPRSGGDCDARGRWLGAHPNNQAINVNEKKN
jgi:hypothetical protein